MELTTAQITAIKCAYADLVGAHQAYIQSDIHVHNWKDHLQTISDLENVFEFIDPADPFLGGEYED